MTDGKTDRTTIGKTCNRYIKICGLTKLDQAMAIAKMGANAIGFICVAKSPRYIDKQAIAAITSGMMANQTDQMLPDFIGVFVNASIAEICETVSYAGLTAVQLHGDESPEFCTDLRSRLINQKINPNLPNIKIIKALRVKDDIGLNQAQLFTDHVDAILLDAYDPHLHGGTGKTINWQMLQSFQPKCPWWLAGGLSPENVAEAIAQVAADGLDVSSGVERSAGDKDLERVAQFLAIAHQ